MDVPNVANQDLTPFMLKNAVSSLILSERNNVLDSIDKALYFLYHMWNYFDDQGRRIVDDERFYGYRKPNSERHYVFAVKQARPTAALAH